jgi:hypothetical protein
MGRTLSTANQIILEEQREFADFRRALRKPEQAVFDELFANVKKYTPSISMAGHALPFEAVLLALLVDEELKIRALEETIHELRRNLDRLLAEQSDGT